MRETINFVQECHFYFNHSQIARSELHAAIYEKNKLFYGIKIIDNYICSRFIPMVAIIMRFFMLPFIILFKPFVFLSIFTNCILNVRIITTTRAPRVSYV